MPATQGAYEIIRMIIPPLFLLITCDRRGGLCPGTLEIFSGHPTTAAERQPEHLSERPQGASWWSGSEARMRRVEKRSVQGKGRPAYRPLPSPGW